MSIAAFFSGNSTWSASMQFRGFRYLLLSTFFHSIGMGMEQLALGWLVYEMTDSPFMVGVATGARMAPFFFLGILSGAIADRVERRIHMRFATLGVGAISSLMAIAIISGAISPENTGEGWRVALVVAVALASGSVWAYMMTLKQSYTYDLVGPTYSLNGLSLNGMGQRFGGIAGALLAGFIIVRFGVGAQYMAVASTFVLAFIALLPISDVGQSAPKERGTVSQNLRGYFRVLRDNKNLRVLMLLTSATEVFGFSHQTLLPVLARDVMDVDAVGLGYMRAVQQAGGLVGLLMLANMYNFRKKGVLMFALAGAFGLAQIGLGFAPNLALFLFALVIVNGCAMAVDTLYKTLMQLAVSNEERGRAMGSWVLSIGTAPIGHMNVGFIAGAFSAPIALLVNGTVLAAVTITAAVSMPKIRRLE
jgi:MFS family permease